jgi:hypothetical protein
MKIKIFLAEQIGIGAALLVTLVTSSAAVGKSVIDLQANRKEQILDYTNDKGEKFGFIRLTNLNPEINSWFVLAVVWPGSDRNEVFHLENPRPRTVELSLEPASQRGIKVTEAGKSEICELWSDEKSSELVLARNSNKTFASICNGKIIVRNKTDGKESTKEWATDFLRKHVPGGEQITSLVKDYIYKDKFLIAPELTSEARADDSKNRVMVTNKPKDAELNPEFKDKMMKALQVGIDLGGEREAPFSVGTWTETKGNSNIYFSAIEPKMVKKEILASSLNRVQKLDAVEESAAVYSVAFNLAKFDVGFTMGTSHPSAEWSDRTREEVRKKDMTGPDGFHDFSPLIMTGLVPTDIGKRIVGTFTGGFKRSHSAFKWGELSTTNNGSHYGFIEQGVVLSKLIPKLATIIGYKDGSIAMKTWTLEDEKTLSNIRFARQNGVPIIEYDPATKTGIPGEFVGKWNLGNWSGSQESKQRALRAGICLQESSDKQFLIYSYFSTATPNAMARVFQAYNCSYAFHLDMNALEHTYLALYKGTGEDFKIEHLIEGMNVLDRKVNGQVVPRFIGAADNRDFFYLFKK